jgi:hypothetical protein
MLPSHFLTIILNIVLLHLTIRTFRFKLLGNDIDDSLVTYDEAMAADICDFLLMLE